MQLVYLSPTPWASFAQRPHAFIEWFRAATGGQILWLDPYPARLPRLDDLRRLSARDSVTSFIPHWLTVIKPQALPLEPVPGSGYLNRMLWNKVIKKTEHFASAGKTLLGIGKPSRLALQLLGKTCFSASFYDAMDDFPAFHSGLSRVAMKRIESRIAQLVSCMLVSSTALHTRWAASREVILARNACASRALPPAGTEKPAGNVLGYVGTIGHWFDWNLVIQMAQSRPATDIRLIGPMHASPPSPLPQNITILPPCAHPEALAAMQTFSAGLIPFKITELTDSVDPIKYYEYCALGLPVITTAFGEMRHHLGNPGVFCIDARTDKGAVIDSALGFSTGTGSIAKFRAENSWEARFELTGLHDLPIMR